MGLPVRALVLPQENTMKRTHTGGEVELESKKKKVKTEELTEGGIRVVIGDLMKHKEDYLMHQTNCVGG